MQMIYDFMSKDHDRLDGIFKEFQQATHSKPQGAKKLFSDFSSNLKRHIIWEEEILFPIFEERTGMKEGGPTEAMRFEHTQIKGFLEEIERKISAGQASTEPELKLLNVLTEHNTKEEHILYPWIDESLSKKEVEDVLKKINTNK